MSTKNNNVPDQKETGHDSSKEAKPNDSASTNDAGFRTDFDALRKHFEFD